MNSKYFDMLLLKICLFCTNSKSSKDFKSSPFCNNFQLPQYLDLLY